MRAGRVYWHEVVSEIERRGHGATPVEIRGDDPALGLPEYAAITDEAIGDHHEVVLVAQSMGGFTAPMLAKLDRVSRIVFLNAMIPLPGETPSQWFDATGQQAAFEAGATVADGHPTEYDVDTVFLHDIPSEVRAAMADGDRERPTPPSSNRAPSSAGPTSRYTWSSVRTTGCSPPSSRCESPTSASGSQPK